MWCAVYRTLICWSADGESGTLTRRHLRRCPACRQYAENLSDLEAALARESRPATGVAVSPEMAAGWRVEFIIPARTSSRRWALAAAALAAVVILVIGITLRMSNAPAPTPIGQGSGGVVHPAVAAAPLPSIPLPSEIANRGWQAVDQYVVPVWDQQWAMAIEDFRTAGQTALDSLPIKLLPPAPLPEPDSRRSDVR